MPIYNLLSTCFTSSHSLSTRICWHWSSIF